MVKYKTQTKMYDRLMGMYISGLEFKPGVPGARLKKIKWQKVAWRISKYKSVSNSGLFRDAWLSGRQISEKNWLSKNERFYY